MDDTLSEHDRRAFRAGFVRSLYLSGCAEGEGDLYSEQFKATLLQYFGPSVHHRKFPQWWLDHMGARVRHALTRFLPWCERYVTLRDKVILEVGCGTGSSTVALAARARRVIAVDVHGPSLAAARRRLQEDGFAGQVDFVLVDPMLRDLALEPNSVDVVVLYAVLEHMLPAERRACLDRVWDLLAPRGRLVVFETPNRLWPLDIHTTGLWGWSWLPRRLALWYGKARRRFEPTADLEQMYREGYGLTYWEVAELLRGKHYVFARAEASERPLHKLLARLFMLILHVPRWALARDLSFVVQKLS